MPDREKVIKAIDICLGHGKCHDCHYSVAEAGYTAINCRECMMRDALKLLKEQYGLMLALEQSNAANEYLNAEVERLTGLLKEQQEKRKNRLPYSPDSNVQWT